MTNTNKLDRIVRLSTAFASMADMEFSMADGYVPTVHAAHGPCHVALRLELVRRDWRVYPAATASEVAKAQ